MAKAKKSLKTDYFHGIAPLVAKNTGYSEKYVGNVLRGKFDDRNTDAIKQIKAAAALMMKPVNDFELVEA